MKSITASSKGLRKLNCNPQRSHFCVGKLGRGSCIPNSKACRYELKPGIETTIAEGTIGKGNTVAGDVPNDAPGNPKFRNQTGTYDLDSITGIAGKVNPSEVERLATLFAKSNDIPPTALIDLDSIEDSGKVTWDKEKIEAVAQSIVKNNGTVLKSPVVKRMGIDRYSIADGANELRAFLRAREINPSIPDRIRVYDGKPEAIEPFRLPPIVKKSGVKDGEEVYEVVSNASVYRAYERARGLNPNLPDRFRAYELGKGETLDSLMPQLED